MINNIMISSTHIYMCVCITKNICNGFWILVFSFILPINLKVSCLSWLILEDRINKCLGKMCGNVGMIKLTQDNLRSKADVIKVMNFHFLKWMAIT
jgi:hypothetical protein